VKTVEELIDIAARLFNLPSRVVEFLRDLPWDAIEAAYKAALAAGERPGKAADRLAKAFDAAVDWREVVAGPGGIALEMADGPLLRLAFAYVLRFGFGLGS
jgi:hypothetical protein